jgi:hypothetical protein
MDMFLEGISPKRHRMAPLIVVTLLPSGMKVRPGQMRIPIVKTFRRMPASPIGFGPTDLRWNRRLGKGIPAQARK